MNIERIIKNNKYKYIFFFVGISFILFLSACLKNDDDETGSIPASLVSFVHASPDAEALIVGINGYRVNNQSFNFRDRIIYQYLYPGGNQFQVNTAAENKKLDVKDWNLEGGVCYSIFAVDQLDSLELLGVRDFYAKDTPEDGFARVRFINLSPDSLSLDLKASAIDTLLASEKKFKQNSSFGNIKADDNTSYTLDIINHETGTLLDKITFEPKQGQYYTIMAAGYMDTEIEAQRFKASVLKHD